VTQRTNVIVTGAGDIDDVKKRRVERHSEQFDVVSELHMSFCNMDA